MSIQSKNTPHIQLSYQVGRENQSDIILDEVRPALGELRLRTYYYEFLQMREKRNKKRTKVSGENLDRQ